MKKIILFLLLSSILFNFSTQAQAGQTIKGQILAINDNTQTILLESNEEIKEYSLALNNRLKLNDRAVSINALSPIKEGAFIETAIKLDQAGQIKELQAYYQAVAIEIKEVKEEKIVVKKLNAKELKNYQLTEEIEVFKNNQLSQREEIKVGDQGLMILGKDENLRRLFLSNYRPS